jgi:hypothetical protein
VVENTGSLVAVVVRHSHLQQELKVEVLVDLMLVVETHLQIVTNLVKLAIMELQTLVAVAVVVMQMQLTREEEMVVLASFSSLTILDKYLKT